ncbi:MAG: hypothetical protein CVU52_08205 [Deltaproteobacteria bacterium HGW-Deltaproteobacteria-10]|nr:MAG: hypothetical protein CVU52_08205 [Deltaproteobacteria bacterium HGW-Deltaproteobacteria-10]
MIQWFKTDTGIGEGLPRRKSIRLAGYDYSKEGLYFVTICVQDRLHLFGEITSATSVTSVTSVGEDQCVFPGVFPKEDLRVFPKMELNDAGQMVVKWWNELNSKYRHIELHEHIIMPNHFHGIIQIVDLVKTVGTNKTGCSGEHTEHNSGEHAGSPLHAMMQWFKTMTTNEYIRNVKQNGWPPFNKKLWQRNYYEHIIRDEKSYQRIAEYIVNNSVNWQIDKYNEQNNSSKFKALR